MADKQKTSSEPKSKGTAPLPEDFETALAQLETLVAKMEDGEMPLEQSLAAYERGVALSKRCQSLLDAAEQQVKVLQGNLLKPLDADETTDDSQS
ncbi:MAG: exodeoxyribonuclease VII small subunit [Pusillimonas sp.]|nr:exodeoxyribonuclease VII small subunit [Pusillimonas sp.]MBC43266.1 exodeoxyribonuclease VII small subunit [Pusillimonas sp.]HCP78589.1 exodeoxyribonuclease VII small subunit [Pusillimonas sp.]|tara:strand:+ start:767 stop:1051 length:285 start_codon:yes stop_codon:yes gene_type:complete